MQLQVEGRNTDDRSVSRTFAWAVGDIAQGGTTFFAVEPVPGSGSYHIEVALWDPVSFGEAP